MFSRIFHSLVVLLSLALFTSTASAQLFTGTYSAGVSVGYSTFSMEQLKDMQRELKRQYPVDMKILEEFPGYWNYNASFLIYQDERYYGWVVGHTSTGGRLYYSDYTGHIASDQIVTMTYTGATMAKTVSSNEIANILLGAQGLLYFNKLKLIEARKVYDENSLVVERFNSRCLALQGFVELQKSINKFQLKLQAGYEVQLPGQLLYQNRKDYYMVNSSNEKVRLNAGGIRTSLGVHYTITP